METVYPTTHVLFPGSAVFGGFWLYLVATTLSLLLTLMSAQIFYTTFKRYLAIRNLPPGGIRSPIGISRIMLMCLSALIFLRVSIDTIILLIWQEVSPSVMITWHQINEFFNMLAIIPFIIFFYLMIRAGAVIEFQLLRQPIPTDLHPSWKLIRGPVISLTMMVLLSLLVVSTKLIQ